MINKQSLWFVTLFSLIIVLSIYYFSTDQTNLKLGKYQTSSSYVAKNVDENNNINVLKVADDETTIGKIDELQNILLDSDATLEEKNNAYDELEVISSSKTKEEELSRIIKKELNYDSFVKIKDNNVNVVVSNSVHSNEVANNIIKLIQSRFKEDKYITVKFEG